MNSSYFSKKLNCEGRGVMGATREHCGEGSLNRRKKDMALYAEETRRHTKSRAKT